MGEIDLVVVRGNELVFVEVKTRSSSTFGDAFESVNYSKQRKLVKMAHLYLKLKPQLSDKDYRIDVAAVDIDNNQQPVIILTNAIDDLT
jgi:putative endonuclease